MGPHSMKKRALKSGEKKKGRESKADPQRILFFLLVGKMDC